MKTTFLLSGTILLLALPSCDKSPDTATTAPIPNSLTKVLLPEKPTDAISVAEAFASAIPGTELTVTGEVLGKLEPFIENRAMLVLGDPTKITACNRNHDDACQTPWDVCCDTPETIKKSIATIQVVDESGRPLKQGLKGLGGIQELTTLTVVGTVAEGSNPENLLINATGIHVGETDPFMAQN